MMVKVDMGRLVLAGDQEEVFLIGDNIKITLIDAKPNTRMLIEAPKGMPVDREEIRKKKESGE